MSGKLQFVKLTSNNELLCIHYARPGNIFLQQRQKIKINLFQVVHI